MRGIKYVLLAAFAFMIFGLSAPAKAQVSIGIGIGAEPVCPYGYYGYAPYRCAPYGYYGPQWFNSGIFIGAGRWHRGPVYHGLVNRSYDPRFGYRGAYPDRGARFDNRDFRDFRGSHYSDGRGHYHNEGRHDRWDRH